jgi:hypothetical protein
MKREEFVFTIGYQGDTAIVDGYAMKKYKKYTTQQLLDEGFFKEAFCSALYKEDEDELTLVLEKYNQKSERKYSSIEELKRLFGVFNVPSDVTTKVNIL